MAYCLHCSLHQLFGLRIHLFLTGLDVVKIPTVDQEISRMVLAEHGNRHMVASVGFVHRAAAAHSSEV